MKLKSGLVSIGVPTFNRPEQLRHCLDGLVKQTYPNLEIIISDNCSTLPEVALVAVEFCSRDNRITYFKQKSNIGAIKNFQYVLSRADGEYFMWAADRAIINILEIAKKLHVEYVVPSNENISGAIMTKLCKDEYE